VADPGCASNETAHLERKTLWGVLVINGLMFVGEALAGWWGESTGLLADSLDMLADASVCGSALYAVGRLRQHQINTAALGGVLQVALGLGVFIEVVRRYADITGSPRISRRVVWHLTMGCACVNSLESSGR